MGGLRKYLPLTYIAFLVGSLALVGDPALLRLLLQGRDPRRGAGRGLVRRRALGRRNRRRGADGLYTFRMVFIVFGGEPSAFVREHFHALKERSRRALRWPSPVAVLAVLATFGGWIQFAAVWTPISTFLDPVAPPLVEAIRAAGSSSRASAASSPARRDLARLVDLRRAARCAVPRVRRPCRLLLEHKFYFDELYDAASSTGRRSASPARWPRSSRRRSSAARSSAIARRRARGSAPASRRIQTGLVRLYALAIAAGAAVLAIVFVAVR